MIYVYVGLGGMVGSLLRWLVSVSSKHLIGNVFPIGTLLVNIVGSFLLGWLTSAIIQRGKWKPEFAAAIGTGVIGSFTTLSTLSVDTVHLLQEGEFLSALLYLLISAIGGGISGYFGLRIGNKVREEGAS